VQIGDAWAGKRIDIATEHLATNYLRHVLLMWMESGPPPFPTQPIVLACAPGEWHEGGLLMIGALLRRARWPVAYLGQAVPLADLATIVRDLAPAMIVATATSPEAASALAEWPQHLPDAARSGHPVVCYAGRVFDQSPEWRQRVQGMYLGATLRDGWQTIESFLG
jgi:MerR family transcriptional regulator, light-induced transcriptional regulator